MANSISTIFDFANQVNLYKYNVERNFTILSGQIEQRAVTEQALFDQRQRTELSPSRTRLADLQASKENIADHLDRVRRARENIVEIKGALADAASAAQSGSRAKFDAAMLTLNLKAGNSRTDSENLIGRMGTTQVGSRTEYVDLPGGDVELQTRSLSSTYAIRLSDGSQLTPDVTSNSIKINGKKYDLPTLTFVSSGGGNDVTFSVDNNGTTETYTGTIERGGLGVASSFFYGGLPADASAQSQAYRQQAIDDVRVALKQVNDLDKALAAAESEIARGFGSVSVDLDATTAEIDNVTSRQADEARVFNRALQTRTQVALSSLALSAKTAETMLTSMFSPKPEPTESVLDQLGFNYSRSKG